MFASLTRFHKKKSFMFLSLLFPYVNARHQIYMRNVGRMKKQKNTRKSNDLKCS